VARKKTWIQRTRMAGESHAGRNASPMAMEKKGEW
jgi:hypothetical protein